MNPATERVIFHVDMDAFYASVEQRENPEYRGRPVIVGALPGTRGVVCASSYEARKFGVKSAMPVSRAHALCPSGIFVVPQMKLYSEVSHKIMEIFDTFSPLKEQISVDEAFLDMSGTRRIHGEPREAALAVQRAVLEGTGLTCSIGVAPNKLLAKIASDMNKPRGLTITPFDRAGILKWLAPMSVRCIWGIGEKTAETLRSVGAVSVGQLQEFPENFLKQRFGSMGEDLYRLCRGIDDRELSTGRQQQSISREHTFEVDCSEQSELKRTLLILSRDVAQRARKSGLCGNTVTLVWRLPDFSRRSRRLRLDEPTDLAREIYTAACAIFDNARAEFGKLRLIGVGISGLDDVRRTNLFDDLTARDKQIASELAMDAVVSKFGKKAIFLGGEKKA